MSCRRSRADTAITAVVACMHACMHATTAVIAVSALLRRHDTLLKSSIFVHRVTLLTDENDLRKACHDNKCPQQRHVNAFYMHDAALNASRDDLPPLPAAWPPVCMFITIGPMKKL